MERTLTIETINKIGQKVRICGWVATVRDHGKLVFIDLRDRSGLIQIIGGKEFAQLRPQDVVCVVGEIQKRPEKMINAKIPTGTVEIKSEELKILSKAEELPFDMGLEELEVELPTLLDWRALSLRHPKVQAIFKVQEVIVDSFRRALKEKNFTEFQAPSIIPEIPEGGANVFEVKYFDHKAYLAQSPQLYKQILVGVFERVFSVNKVFRAEPSTTARHLTEVVCLDAEFGFINSWLDVVEMAEYTIKYILKSIEEKCREELKMFGATIPQIKGKIPVVKLREAQEIIYQRTGLDHRQEKDLAPEDEREICKWAAEEKGSELVFVSHYPTKARPFYTYPDPENPEYNQGFDLIGRGVEWLTGGRRIENYQMLLDHAKEWGVDPQKIEIYLQAFRFGMPPEGGFSFGAERITMLVLGLKNIREAAPFPRDMERIDVSLMNKPPAANDNEGKQKLFEKIIKLLDSKKIKYQLYEHKSVFTSEQAAKARGTRVEQGAKALVMMADDKPVILVISAAKKINTAKFKKDFKVRDLRMATSEEVKQLTGTEIGAVPPFGNLMGLEVFVDKSFGENKEIAFNAGLHTRSLKIGYTDWAKLVKPRIGDFAANE